MALEEWNARRVWSESRQFVAQQIFMTRQTNHDKRLVGHQQDTLERIFSNLEQNEIRIRRARMDCGSCSREIVETVEKHSEHFYIRANRCGSLYDSLLALRGWQREEINGVEYELNSK